MRLLAGFGLLVNAVILFLFDPPAPQTKTLQMEKIFVLMTMQSFLTENQALEWPFSEEDGIFSHFWAPKERYISHFKSQDSKRDGIENKEYLKGSQGPVKGNVFDSSKTSFKKRSLRIQREECHL